MRAARLQSEKQMVMIDAEMPRLTHADHVLVQVKTVGICGSEVHAFNGTHPYRKAPVVLGHEVAGVIAQVGLGIRRFKEGDRVIVDPQWSCGECTYCRTGNINLCPDKRVLGTAAWPGGFGEFIIAPEEAVFPLSRSLSFTQGSLIEPLTVAVHVARRAGVESGESVAILGSGSIGSLLAGVCHILGANPIVAADIRAHCVAIAGRLGATQQFVLPDDNFVQKARKIAGGDGVDVVFVTADDVALVNLAFDLVKRRGRIVLVALLTGALLQFAAFPIISKELQIIGSVMSNKSDVQRAIAIAASGRIDIQAIATHTLPIEQAQQGMELAETKSDGAVKVILTF